MDGWIQRSQWVEALTKISEPVLNALSQEKLKKCLSDQENPSRRAFAPLSAFGRVMCGISGPCHDTRARMPDRDHG